MNAYLAQWRLEQREHDHLTADHQADAFYAELDPALPRLDLAPMSAVEIRHLGHSGRRTT